MRDSGLRGDQARAIAQRKPACGELSVPGTAHLTGYRTMFLRTPVLDSAKLETWREAHQARRGIT